MSEDDRVGPSEHEPDIPYGEDWQSEAEVAAWAEAADQKRPWRSRFRDRIAEQIATLAPNARVLELGSGPGFLAERVRYAGVRGRAAMIRAGRVYELFWILNGAGEDGLRGSAATPGEGHG